MGIAKRKFRIETVNKYAEDDSTQPVEAPSATVGGAMGGSVRGNTVPDALAAERHQQMMDAIAKLGSTIGNAKDDEQELAEAAPDALLDKYKDEIKEAAKLKYELEQMQQAILRTKSEIVALRYEGASSDRIRSVTDELDEVVAGTEGATEVILDSAEVIDSAASALVSSLQGVDAGQAQEIQEQVIRIFEACNFQDITGQRINKVVTALRFIEERVESMLSIWGKDSFEGVESADDGSREGEPEGRTLANGPSMPEADDRSSQDDIDALFD
ncbi:MAG: hypothetical protein COA62_06410 [Rhodobiaceae bacterium]|nr:MAG: hypothetical protein COA62_06410 [Rhodobiaceae bacterium]